MNLSRGKKWYTILALAGAVGFAAVCSAAEPKPADVEFFEKKIRPVLVERCYKCHSAQAKALKGGLRLDTRAGVRKGGESGPAIVPGKPEASLLLKALRYGDDALKMPPGKKLPDAVIADFEHWIATGAPDPRASDAAPVRDLAAARRHWSFQPLRSPALPTVKNREWAATPVDRFILAKLETQGLTPSPPADRRTLMRRAYYDLIGLPPTFEEICAFENDRDPEAFAKVVDHLLASPRYGERWGRHWLDVARFADTKDGVLMFGDDRVRPYAYTYRDYVIRAWNEDTPFDRFVHEQLAADQIEPKVEPWRLAAMGFLTLGRMFDNNIHDVIDDRIDTVSRGFLGLTVACARCHDHKYDPIPMADYYSLYGVFANCEEPLELPIIGQSASPAGFAEFEKKASPKRKELAEFLDKQYDLLLETARQRVGDYLVHVATTKPDPLETAIFFQSLAPEDLRPQMVAAWRRYVEQHSRSNDPVFGPWHDLMAANDTDFAKGVKQVRASWSSRPPGSAQGQWNPLVSRALEKATLNQRADVAKAYGQLLHGIYEDSKKSVSGNRQDEAARQRLLAVVTSPGSPAYFPKHDTWYYMSRAEKDAYGGKRTELDRLAVQSPAAPPRAMVLADAQRIVEPHILLRGNPGRPAEQVPRQFLWIEAGDHRQPFSHGSGRLDLARAITAPDNPLTSRVLVNRVWMYHFGEPLVDTPSDFGTRSTPPAHPELLDFLALAVQREGWSLKKLHRMLMLSNAYQQASLDRPECSRLDPENRLLWRMNRQRLDLESMRDTLLAVSGRLEDKLGGRPENVASDAANRRRTVYGIVDRQSLPGLYRAFDFASPDQSAERRLQTTVPQQALFGMNSPFVLEQARTLAARPEVARESDPAHRVATFFRLTLGREPVSEEVTLALAFVDATKKNRKQAEKSQLEPWQQYAQVLLLTNELLFVD